MKIYITHKISESGKGKFLQRLIHAFEDMGHKCIYHDGGDVALGLIYWMVKTKRPKVLRLNGVHFQDRPRSYWINKKIRKSANASDAVIWQSEFCRLWGRTLCKVKCKREYVIYNGAPIVKTMPRNGKPIVVSVARWKDRPQKGLVETIRVGKMLCERNPDLRVYIAGKAGRDYKTNQMELLGHLDSSQLQELYQKADVMLYLASYDWCPNSVVEAMCSGLPVVYIKGTGVEEIVGDCGIGIERTEPLLLKMTKEKPRPKFNYDDAVNAVEELLKQRQKIVRPELDIEFVAQQYIKVFEDVLADSGKKA